MQKPMEFEREWLPLSYASEYFKIDMMTAYRLAKKGKIPAVKVGGQWRVHRGRIQDFARRQSTGL